MTDNIKAKGDELVEKFLPCVSMGNTNRRIKKMNIKATQCAIIAVEEIIKIVPMYTGNLNLDWQFWNEVLNYLKSKQ